MNPEEDFVRVLWEEHKLSRSRLRKDLVMILADRVIVLAAKDEEEAENEIRAIGKKLGVTFKFSGDLRGVKLMTPKSGRFNSSGGPSEGWGVP